MRKDIKMIVIIGVAILLACYVGHKMMDHQGQSVMPSVNS